MGPSSRARRARPDHICGRLAADQHGVINLEQALGCGLSPSAIKRRLRDGRWSRLLPRTYAIVGVPASWQRDLMAACIWAGEGAAASHRSAAALWRFEGFARRVIEISVTRHKLPGLHGLVVHRVHRHLLSEIQPVEGIPTTSVRRTLLDLAGVKDRRTEQALDYALRQGLASLGELWLLYEEEWTRGRRGIAILRGLLESRTPSHAPTQSELEAMMQRLIRKSGLPPPRTQYPIELASGTIHVDMAYTRAKLAIECDSYAWHMDRDAFEHDRQRDIELQALGWRVLRFTWARVKWEPHYVVAHIRQHLGLSAPTASSAPSGPYVELV